MNDKTPTPQMPDNFPDCSMAELAYLALSGSYGQRLIAGRYLETIAKDHPIVPKPAFPKGRWT